MNRFIVDPKLPDIESYFAVERELVPEAKEFRERVVERARASVALQARFTGASPSRQRTKIAVAATAAVVLTALCAAAFLAGYRIRNRNAESIGKVPQAPPSVIVQQVPSQPVVVALIPVATSASQFTSAPDAIRASRVSPGGSAKSAIDVESYTKELRVLQPARQAVARQDYSSALSAISEHQRLYPSGRLTEEREALRVKALVGLGRNTEAQRTGAAFRSRFPRSALLGRIEEMLGTQK